MKNSKLALICLSFVTAATALQAPCARAQYLDEAKDRYERATHAGRFTEQNQAVPTVPSERTSEHLANRVAYVSGLRESTLFGLGLYATGDLVGAVASCGIDTVGLAITAIAETLPVAGVVTFLGHDIGGDSYEPRLDVLGFHRLHTGDSDIIALQLVLGGPLSIAMSGIIEGISNGWKLATQRNPAGVNFDMTARNFIPATYIQTEDEFLAAFADRDSDCRHSLWKLHQIGHAMIMPKSMVAATAPTIDDAASAAKTVAASIETKVSTADSDSQTRAQ